MRSVVGLSTEAARNLARFNMFFILCVFWSSIPFYFVCFCFLFVFFLKFVQ